MKIKELQKLDKKHFIHPFTDSYQLAKTGTRVLSGGDGVYVTDTTQNQMIDGMSGLWCCNLGYGRAEIVDAIIQQVNRLPFYNSFYQCTTEPAIRLSQLLAEISPKNLDNVFFTSSGSEANDTNLRIIKRYWDLKGEHSKYHVISLVNAYHGSTIASASLGGMDFMHKQFNVLDLIHHIPNPDYYNCADEIDEDEFGTVIANKLEEKIQQLGPENVAAFFAEPIQGAGGVIIPPRTYWPRIKEILKKYDVLFVVDEVIMGFGRTGEWFGSFHYDLEPDLMTFAKGITNGYIPLGGVMVSNKIAQVIKSPNSGEFAHGYTYSGHPVACSAAIATIEYIRKNNVLETVKNEKAPYLKGLWQDLADHPIVGEARILGMVGALEIVKNKETKERFDNNYSAGKCCRIKAQNNGVVMRATKDTMIIAPPLVITKKQIKEMIERVKLSLDQVQEELGL